MAKPHKYIPTMKVIITEPRGVSPTLHTSEAGNKREESAVPVCSCCYKLVTKN